MSLQINEHPIYTKIPDKSEHIHSDILYFQFFPMQRAIKSLFINKLRFPYTQIRSKFCFACNSETLDEAYVKCGYYIELYNRELPPGHSTMVDYTRTYEEINICTMKEVSESLTK